jgi:hypothetical protein
MDNNYEKAEALAKVGTSFTIAGCSCMGIILLGIVLAIPVLFILGTLFAE